MKNLIAGFLFCLLSGAVSADTWTVDDDGIDFPKAFFDINCASIDFGHTLCGS